MKYSVDKQEKYTVFKLEEINLNALLAPELKSKFVILFNEGTHNLILDLSVVEYVDSSGLSAILTADRLWKQLGSFVLTGVQHPSVEKLIEISQLDDVLTIIPTLSESIDYVFMEELEREIGGEGVSDDDVESED
jgi:anti-anti-sigma factor